ncbi:MAG: bi-domain-containing oxidoreductase [Nitrososphaeria archaeon]
MKIVLLDLKTGKISVEDIPIPIVGSKSVLVKTHYSSISLGTELRTIKFAKSSLLGKVKQRPDLVKRVLETIKKNGLLDALIKVSERISLPFTLGYSVSGEVIDVGKEVKDFKVGDRVACAGAEYAFHAEVNSVPEMMCVKVPNNVDLKEAAFVAVGSIAIHAVRNARISIGDIVAVIGLGLVGLITIQVLKAAGCVVIGVDVDDRKIELAKQLGIDVAFKRNTLSLEEKILGLTNGKGVDAVIITASSKNNDPINLAGRIARDKARIVVLGDVGTEFEREIYYRKELELIVSRSYGPGRYDTNYEENCVDYPFGFVRWTERRNMEEFIRLLSKKQINLNKLITHEFFVDDAPKAYELILTKNSELIVGVVFKYNINQQANHERFIYLNQGSFSPITITKDDGTVRIGLIGTGSHAVGNILPILKKLKKKVEFIGVSSAKGLSSMHVAKKYGFNYVTTDYRRIIEDPNIDAVFILTRNSLHAKITVEALEKGKHVFVEKPLALSIEELNNVIKTWKKSGRNLMVGFNRRYSPFTRELLKYLANRHTPCLSFYRINAEKLDPTHWVYDPIEGGGRIISELPHFVDYLIYVVRKEPKQVSCKIIETSNNMLNMDNFLANLYFTDGSIGSILYTSQGSRFYSKEYFELHTEGVTAIIKDFKSFDIKSEIKNITRRSIFKAEKGHYEEITEFINALLNKQDLSHETEIALTSTVASLIAYKSAMKNGYILTI